MTLSNPIGGSSVLTWILGLSFALISCPVFAKSADLSRQSEEPSTEVFILRQLIEIQNELKNLRKEVSGLRETIKQNKLTGTAPRSKKPAPSTPVDVLLDQDDPVLGNREAKIAIVEFTDYQCPYCSKYHSNTFPGLKKDYIDTGKVQYILRDYPLGFHAKAKGASIAANCAGKQNKYWEMKHELFEKQKELGDALYRQAAESLNLNMVEFAACQADPMQAEEVAADFTAGQKVGVRGTPTFLIGRIRDGKVVKAKRIAGAQPLQVFSQIIKPLLEEVEKK